MKCSGGRDEATSPNLPSIGQPLAEQTSLRMVLVGLAFRKVHLLLYEPHHGPYGLPVAIPASWLHEAYIDIVIKLSGYLHIMYVSQET